VIDTPTWTAGYGFVPEMGQVIGAFGTIESCFAGLLPALARHFEAIAVELQGHWPLRRC
jgi:hypothetical protein